MQRRDGAVRQSRNQTNRRERIQGMQRMKFLALRSLSSFAATKLFAEFYEVGDSTAEAQS